MWSRLHARSRQIGGVFLFFILSFLWWYRPESSIAGQYPCPEPYHVQTCKNSFNIDQNGAATQSSPGLGGPQAFSEQEDEFLDGTKRYERVLQDQSHKPTLLVLTVTKDTSSYGHDKDKPQRSFQDYLDLLVSTGLDLSRVSLGLSTVSETEFETFKTATLKVNITNSNSTSNVAFPRLTLLLHKQPKSHTGLALNRDDRHTHDIKTQHNRRSYIAQLRNTLTFHSLRTESHILWLDADIQKMSPNLIQVMLAHMNSNRAAGLLTARCQEGPTWNYDRNSWYGTRPHPEDKDQRRGDRKNVEDLIAYTSTKNELYPLTAIGGTVLLIRSSLVYRGLVFPTGNVIGVQWDKDGYDGIETEGLCVLAKHLGEIELGQTEQPGCWVLGGNNFVGHTNY